MKDWLRDARAAARSLSARPGFAVIAVSTLALGIGANTAIFSLVDAVLLEPLPFPEPERLVRISETAMRDQLELRSLSYPLLRELREDDEVFEEAAGVYELALSVSDEAEPERVLGEAVTPSYFRLLGMRSVLGRLLDDEDDRVDLLQPSVVLSDGYWRRRYGADPGVLGGSVVLNEVACTVVGVVAGSGLSGEAAVFVPLEASHHLAPNLSPRRFEARGTRWLDAIGRLRAGVSPEVLDAWMERKSVRLREEHPDVMEDRGVTAFSLEAQMLGDVQRTALLLMVCVGLVMLVVCANLANLLLARSVRRRREVALRLALGATRWRVLRELMTESLLLSLGGGIAGVLLALWARDLLRGSTLFATLPGYVAPSFDFTTWAFVLGLSVATALLFGAAPAAASVGADLATTLKGGSPAHRGGTGGRSLGRGLLVTLQVALALGLTVASALVAQSLLRQKRIDPGFRPDDVYTMRVQLPQRTYDADGARAFSRELRERLSSIPGIGSVALSSDVPLADGYRAFLLRIEEQARRDPEARLRTYHHEVSPGFFSTMGIPLLRGRDFTALDSRDAPRVAIVSEKLARLGWPNEDPVGKRISVNGPDGPWREVVGLVSDVRYRDLVIDPMLNPDDPDVYLPLSQSPSPQIAVLVNAAGGSGAGPSLVARIREEVRALDPGMPVFEVSSMSDVVAEELALARVASALLGSFGVVSVLLACLGLYGLLSHWVAESSREIGIQMALGAGRGRIVNGILRRGMGLVGGGLAAGILLALALSRFLESRLYEIATTDLFTFVSCAALLAGVGLAAAYLPARRATRLSPVVVLKQN